MKSNKKRFKSLLMEISLSANELALLSADLTLLSEIQHVAKQVLSSVTALNLQIAELNKAEFRDGIADAQALSALEEIVDLDAISILEDCLFAEQKNLEGSGIGEFLQQILEKFDKRYSRMIEDIQQLSALLEEE